MLTNFSRKKLKERDSLEDIGVNGRMILKVTLGKEGVKMWTRCI
jgi:hypothetical protein